MKISVCMGIYNGEKYMEDQLLSILLQTKKADEVILCDDCSSDHTVELVRKFIDSHGLSESWHLICNQENKGYPANFYHAMKLCTGDVVFLADQDDIWQEQKIEKMVKKLEEYQEAKVICCKFALIDSEGKDIHTVMSPTNAKGTGGIRNINIKDVFYKCEWPGMVIAYRNAWYKEQKGEELEICKIPHDFLITARAAEENAFLQLDEELAYHRRHDNNAGGEEHRFGKLLKKQRKVKEIEDYLQILYAFTEGDILQSEEGKEALRSKLQSMEGRYQALQSGKIVKVIKNAWKHRGEVRLATVICDILIVKG